MLRYCLISFLLTGISNQLFSQNSYRDIIYYSKKKVCYNDAVVKDSLINQESSHGCLKKRRIIFRFWNNEVIRAARTNINFYTKTKKKRYALIFLEQLKISLDDYYSPSELKIAYTKDDSLVLIDSPSIVFPFTRGYFKGQRIFMFDSNNKKVFFYPLPVLHK